MVSTGSFSCKVTEILASAVQNAAVSSSFALYHQTLLAFSVSSSTARPSWCGSHYQPPRWCEMQGLWNLCQFSHLEDILTCLFHSGHGRASLPCQESFDGSEQQPPLPFDLGIPLRRERKHGMRINISLRDCLSAWENTKVWPPYHFGFL